MRKTWVIDTNILAYWIISQSILDFFISKGILKKELKKLIHKNPVRSVRREKKLRVQPSQVKN